MDQGSMSYGLPHGFWHQHTPGTELPVTVEPPSHLRPSDAAEITDIDVAPAAA